MQRIVLEPVPRRRDGPEFLERTGRFEKIALMLERTVASSKFKLTDRLARAAWEILRALPEGTTDKEALIHAHLIPQPGGYCEYAPELDRYVTLALSRELERRNDDARSLVVLSAPIKFSRPAVVVPEAKEIPAIRDLDLREVKTAPAGKVSRLLSIMSKDRRRVERRVQVLSTKQRRIMFNELMGLRVDGPMTAARAPSKRKATVRTRFEREREVEAAVKAANKALVVDVPYEEAAAELEDDAVEDIFNQAGPVRDVVKPRVPPPRTTRGPRAPVPLSDVVAMRYAVAGERAAGSRSAVAEAAAGPASSTAAHARAQAAGVVHVSKTPPVQIAGKHPMHGQTKSVAGSHTGEDDHVMTVLLTILVIAVASCIAVAAGFVWLFVALFGAPLAAIASWAAVPIGYVTSFWMTLQLLFLALALLKMLFWIIITLTFAIAATYFFAARRARVLRRRAREARETRVAVYTRPRRRSARRAIIDFLLRLVRALNGPHGEYTAEDDLPPARCSVKNPYVGEEAVRALPVFRVHHNARSAEEHVDGLLRPPRQKAKEWLLSCILRNEHILTYHPATHTWICARCWTKEGELTSGPPPLRRRVVAYLGLRLEREGLTPSQRAVICAAQRQLVEDAPRAAVERARQTVARIRSQLNGTHGEATNEDDMPPKHQAAGRERARQQRAEAAAMAAAVGVPAAAAAAAAEEIIDPQAVAGRADAAAELARDAAEEKPPVKLISFGEVGDDFTWYTYTSDMHDVLDPSCVPPEARDAGWHVNASWILLLVAWVASRSVLFARFLAALMARVNEALEYWPIGDGYDDADDVVDLEPDLTQEKYWWVVHNGRVYQWDAIFLVGDEFAGDDVRPFTHRTDKLRAAGRLARLVVKRRCVEFRWSKKLAQVRTETMLEAVVEVHALHATYNTFVGEDAADFKRFVGAWASQASANRQLNLPPEARIRSQAAFAQAAVALSAPHLRRTLGNATAGNSNPSF